MHEHRLPLRIDFESETPSIPDVSKIMDHYDREKLLERGVSSAWLARNCHVARKRGEAAAAAFLKCLHLILT